MGSEIEIFNFSSGRSMYLRDKRCEDPWLIFEIKKGPRANMFEKRCPRVFSVAAPKYL